MTLSPEATHLECYRHRHILGQVYKAAGGRKGLSMELLWQLRRSETFENWSALMKKIEAISMKAAV